MSTLNCHEEIERLFVIKRNKEMQRLGAIFSTPQNPYFYDTGTGKVLQLDEDAHKIMTSLFHSTEINNVDDLIKFQNISVTAINDFCQTVVDEHLFRAYKPETLYSLGYYENLKEQVNHELSQVILELTGRCNLRCDYCIYNEDYDLHRDFNSSDMSLEIAKAAVDYAAIHSNERIAITFYGGEPLLKFDLLKWVIEYSLETLKGKQLTFSLTTNLTLVTKEIASFLASVPGLGIVCSLDGPEWVQNSYRKFANGAGSFSRAYQGLKLLSEAFATSENFLSINSVFAPPFSFEKLDEINDFFKGLDFLPPKADINIGYVTSGSLSDSKINRDTNMELTPSPPDALWSWIENRSMERSSFRDETIDLSSTGIEGSLLSIENRFFTETPSSYYSLNGCCIPGKRRLYVNTTGELHVCEKVGNAPSIGNIMDGIDFDRLMKFYVEDYSDGSIQQCQNCWAIRLCSMCYSNNYTETEFKAPVKNSKCDFQRSTHIKDLVLYHTLRETAPEKLEFLRTTTIY